FADMLQTFGFSTSAWLPIVDLEILSFPVPDAARERVQFVAPDGMFRVGIVTELGTTTGYVEASLSGCDALVLECNHDPDLLEQSDYPTSLKARISGRFGHLPNDGAATIVRTIDTSRLQHLIAAHLSKQNNTPAMARVALSGAPGCASEWIG